MILGVSFSYVAHKGALQAQIGVSYAHRGWPASFLDAIAEVALFVEGLENLLVCVLSLRTDLLQESLRMCYGSDMRQ